MRVRGSGGYLVYAVPADGGDRTPQVGEFATLEHRLARLCHEVLVSAEASANTSSSCALRRARAQYFASAIDRVGAADILGTIAGEDTILVITRAPDGGSATAERLLTMSRTGKPQPEKRDEP